MNVPRTGAEAFFLQQIGDLVDGCVVSLAQGPNAGRPLILRFIPGSPGHLGLRPEEGLGGILSEGQAQVFERAVGVAELFGGLFGGEAVDIVGPQGFIADVSPRGGFLEEFGVISHSHIKTYVHSANIRYFHIQMQHPGMSQPNSARIVPD